MVTRKGFLGGIIIFILIITFPLLSQSVTGIGNPYGVKGTAESDGSYGYLGFSSYDTDNSYGAYGRCGAEPGYFGVLGYSQDNYSGIRYYGAYGKSPSGCRGALGYSNYAVWGYAIGDERKGLNVTHNDGAIAELASDRFAAFFRGPGPDYDWARIAYQGKGIWAHGEEYAGYFEGDVYVTGDVFAEGTKNNVVKLDDGTWVAMAATESYNPEYTTSGKSKLDAGSVEVTFAHPFPEVISKSVPIRVLITPEGSWSGIYVTDVTENGFTAVCEIGDSNATFSYLAIARVKGKEEKLNVKAFTEMMVKTTAVREENKVELKRIDDEFNKVIEIERRIDEERMKINELEMKQDSQGIKKRSNDE